MYVNYVFVVMQPYDRYTLDVVMSTYSYSVFTVLFHATIVK